MYVLCQDIKCVSYCELQWNTTTDNSIESHGYSTHPICLSLEPSV